ncbi:alpha/beta fold hydrolase [Pseudomonas sp. FBF18]|uniref:alpha/beta fold hydrolase n=1 Tax=unclassified Pseudomonas TaxID=196821 RepID=UPI0006D3D9FA|nr:MULTISPECIES: alpha/beta fold hydrolase [unclassified Pseudomonas]MCP8350624.1 alpha/beta fold hydrolase [Pseudomonas sp. FBF18]
MNQPTHLPLTGDPDAGALSARQALLLLDSLDAGAAPPLEQRLLEDLRDLLLGVLKIDPADFSPTRALMDYGLDSIASTEIGTLFTQRFGISVPPTVFFEFQNLQSFCGYLLANHHGQLLEHYGDSAPLPAPAPVVAAAPPMAQVVAPVAAGAVATPATQGPLSIEALWQRYEHLAPAAPAVVQGTRVSNEYEPSQALLDEQFSLCQQATRVQIHRPGAPRLECATYGSGMPVLMLGGLVMQYDVMWRLQLQALGRGHRLIMLHLPGCGEAELPPAFDIAHLVADIVVLLDQLGIDQPLPVIGYSFGGVLAQAFALAHPHRCAGLCISVSSPFSEGASNFPVLMGELQKSPRFMTLNRGWNMAALPAYQQVIGDFDLRPQLGNLHCPCRIICASDDAYQPPAYSALIANAVPHAELIEVQGAGHLLGFTHHQRYNQLLLEFLHNLPTPEGPARRPVPPVFQPATAHTLQTLEDYVRQGEQGHCAILSAPAAQTALLLNHLAKRGKREPADYRSYFMTSLEEALDAALRLARHHARNRTPDGQGELLLIDDSGYWARYFNPLQRADASALVPGIRVVASLAQALAYQRQHGPEQLAAVACIQAADANAEACDAWLRELAGSGILSLVVEPARQAGHWPLLALCESPDLIVLGEGLSGLQAPLGACLVHERVKNPWLMTPNESYVRHVMSNFGLPFKLAFEHLMAQFAAGLSVDEQRELRRIASSSEATYQAHLCYGNRGYAKIARMHGFDGRFHEARGVRSRLMHDGEPSREIIDCFVNVGTCPRGLNPLDVIEQVARQHDTRRDYWGELQGLLQHNTGLPMALPASSNVTAVEAALTLGLLAARGERHKLLCLSGGLGFSMLSAAASHTLGFDIFRAPFEPLHAHTVFIDPLAEDAEAQLQGHLLSGEIALVWFETIQVDANASRPVPPHLIAMIERHRDAGGYLVGIDETQTNLMTGRFLHSQAQVPQPDIVALGSALCDSLLPMGVVLCSEAVTHAGAQRQPQRVADLQGRGISQLSAHLALNCLQALEREGALAHARTQGEYFHQRLLELQRAFPLIRAVRAEGLLLTVELELAGTPAFVERSFGYLLWGSLLRDPEGGVAAAVCPIHNHCLRYLPPLNIDRDSIDLMVANLRRALARGVDGVLQDCAEHNRHLGDTRTAQFLSSLTHPKKKGPNL